LTACCWANAAEVASRPAQAMLAVISLDTDRIMETLLRLAVFWLM
jgi:hypothetical protein